MHINSVILYVFTNADIEIKEVILIFIYLLIFIFVLINFPLLLDAIKVNVHI